MSSATEKEKIGKEKLAKIYIRRIRGSVRLRVCCKIGMGSKIKEKGEEER
jgi:uncharacterized protein YnzC (UPF0291/DUF896 family)